MEATRGRSALSGTWPVWGPFLQVLVAPPDLSGTRPSGPSPPPLAGGIGRRGAAFGVSAAVWEQMLCGVFGSGGEDVSVSGWRLSVEQQSRTDLQATARQPQTPTSHSPPPPHTSSPPRPPTHPCSCPARKPNASHFFCLPNHMSKFTMLVSQRCFL